MTNRPDAHQITVMLEQFRHGDQRAREQLIEIIHGELHRIAANLFRHEPKDHTLQPTALISELYLRIFVNPDIQYENRAHFFALAASTMRRILVDHARAAKAGRRGGDWSRTDMTLTGLSEHVSLDDMLALDEALDRLRQTEPRCAQVVEMRFFSGLEESEIARALGVAEITVKRDWKFARAWLLVELRGDTRT
jgi:RNA polymerase sigma factor (TIGR02999 family)